MRGLAITPVRLVGLAGILAGCPRSGAPPAREPAPAVEPPPGPTAPRAAWFGTWNEETSKFERTHQIDKVDGVTFGWRIKTACTAPVKFREVMRLPSPGDWSFEPAELPATVISDDQTTTTTIDYAACKQGWVEHRWTVADNDPAGTYVITVELDGYATTTFRPKFVIPQPQP